jgi:DNA-binding beta-propeller fold protein YncE
MRTHGVSVTPSGTQMFVTNSLHQTLTVLESDYPYPQQDLSPWDAADIAEAA